VSIRIVVSLDEAILNEVELTKPVTVVGRHPTCDIVIDHPAVSGRHMLFRVVNRTVYAEDLASTNGIKVNGIATAHHVVHHLDLIELGRHKLHFFDGALLAGGVGDLTIRVTEYERTMLHRPRCSRLPRQRDTEDLSRTMAIRAKALQAMAASGHAIAPQAALARPGGGCGGNRRPRPRQYDDRRVVATRAYRRQPDAHRRGPQRPGSTARSSAGTAIGLGEGRGLVDPDEYFAPPHRRAREKGGATTTDARSSEPRSRWRRSPTAPRGDGR
jgi:hypothetical protein